MYSSGSWIAPIRRLLHWPWRAIALECNGLVVAAHDEGAAPAKDLRPCPPCVAHIGENYLAACEAAGAELNPDHVRALNALRAILGGDPRAYHAQYTRIINGEERWHELSILPLNGGARTLVLNTDITGCKREERELHEAEHRYHTVVNSTTAGYVLIDSAMRIVEINREFLRLAGVPVGASVTGEISTNWITPRDRVRFARMIQEIFASGEPRYCETEWEPPGLERKKAAVNASKVFLKGQPHVALFCLDLSVQNFAIETLRESEARYRAVVETQTELICRFLPDTTLTFANEAFYRFFGRPRDELLHRPLLNLVPPESRPCVRDMIARLITEGTPQTCEHAALAHAGDIRWLQWVHVQIRRADGTVEFQGVGRDVTERHEAEEALRHTRSEVDDLAARLMRVHEEECRRIAREMHDGISQQLAAHAIGLGVLARDFGAQHPEIRKRLQKLEGDAIAIADTVRTFSHELHPAVVDRLGLAAAVHRLARKAAARAGIPFQADIREPLPPLTHEMSYSIYRIAQETLGNIARHAQASRFSVRLCACHGPLELEIEDDGVGFDPKNVPGGAALGLLNIEERVRHLGGELSIESSPGHGTRFRIEFPLSGPSTA